MAKSKSGGTRSFLRGRIANDVYSIGKDGDGKKQQVVRSLAETVANPQTTAQMRGRMIMSTVMQAVSALAQLIDHSFDNVSNGQPSISEFIRRNYQLIKADVADNPASGNSFGLNKYQEKGAKGGKYVISSGSALLPSAVDSSVGLQGSVAFVKTASVTTAKAIRDLIGLAVGDFLTYVAILSDGTAVFYRLKVAGSLPDDTVITADNALQLFTIENPFGLSLSARVTETALAVDAADLNVVAWGTIVSVAANGGWEHNDCVMSVGSDVQFTADVALPTYPIGSEKFLNGGEL